MPTDSFTHTAVARAPLDDVWATMDLPETWGSIPGIDRVVDPVVKEGRLTGFSFESAVAGQRYMGTATLLHRVENEQIAWKIQNSEISGSITVTMKAADEDTELTVGLEVSSVGMMSRMFFPVIAGTLGNGLPKTVEDFAASF